MYDFDGVVNGALLDTPGPAHQNLVVRYDFQLTSVTACV
jgi:hypothetical protein